MQTGVLSTPKAISGVKIILLVQKEKEYFFRDAYGDSVVEVVGIETKPILNARQNQRLFSLGRYFIDSFYTKYKQYEQYRSSSSRPLRYVIERILVKVVSRLTFLRPLYHYLFLRYAETALLRSVFDEYKPTVVFSTDAFGHMDELIATIAEQRGIELVSMVRSWDHAWNKGLLPVKARHIVVNNTAIRDDLCSMHSVAEQDVFVGGVPQHDRFFRRDGLVSREEFFRKIGFDSAQRLILFPPPERFCLMRMEIPVK